MDWYGLTNSEKTDAVCEWVDRMEEWNTLTLKPMDFFMPPYSEYPRSWSQYERDK